MKIIIPNGKIYEYTPIELYHGRKIVNRENIKKNLKELVSVLNKYNLYYGLIYGTLLGAIRENNIIEHDEDADIFMLKEDKEKFLNILFELKNKGLILVRFEEDLISIMKNDDYIDIYFFSQQNKILKNNYYCGGDVINKKFLLNVIDFECLGSNYKIPKYYEELLIKMYGKDWRIPKKNVGSLNYSISTRVKKTLKKILPQFIIKFLKYKK